MQYKNTYQLEERETIGEIRLTASNRKADEIHICICGVLNGKYAVTLYDMNGKTEQKTISSEPKTPINISQLLQGIYIFRVVEK